MGVRVKRIDILEVELPFKKAFKHALRSRQSSSSVFVKIYLDDGTVGYGESLPREYVTGETTGSVCAKLKEELSSKLLGVYFSNLKEAAYFLEKLEGIDGAARCATELALLDAVGKHSGESVSSIIGEKVADEIFYSGVIPAESVTEAAVSALKMKLFGFKQVKVKVGIRDDLKRLEIIRKILGNKIDIRVDANCAWSAEKAIENIGEMRKFKISAIEQPVRADDTTGLKKVTESVSEAIIADESLRTIEDAEKLSGERACNMFNIRLSKCGGILNALKIASIARQNSVGYQLGCQVGESGILSAAGRHLACGLKNIEYFEGSYGKFLLKEDVTKEDTTFKWKGKANALGGPGLGIDVSDEILVKYTVNKYILER